jgi:hypothetical protein
MNGSGTVQDIVMLTDIAQKQNITPALSSQEVRRLHYV